MNRLASLRSIGTGRWLLRAFLIALPLAAIGGAVLVAAWTQPATLDSGSPASPALAYTSDGQLVAAWERSGSLYSAVGVSGTWGTASAVVSGTTPVLLRDSAGGLHLFARTLVSQTGKIGHSQLTGSAWSAPETVCCSTGDAANPAVGAGPTSTMAIAWEQTISTTQAYYGFWDGSQWTAGPGPSTAGTSPAVAAGSDRTIHLVWQEKDSQSGLYDVWYAAFRNGRWTLSENVSFPPAGTTDYDSIAPAVAVLDDGSVLVVWQERIGTNDEVYYARRANDQWTNPANLTASPFPSRTPRLVRDGTGQLHLFWRELAGTPSIQRAVWSGSGWGSAEAVVTRSAASVELAGAAGLNGALATAWTEQAGSTTSLMATEQPGANLRSRLWLPAVLNASTP